MKLLPSRWLLLRIWLVVWLVLVWLLLWGQISPANVLSGLAVSLVITFLLPLPPVPVEGRVHPLSLLWLITWVAWQLVWSSTQVAWMAIRPGPPPRSAVLRAHMDLKSDLVLALAVNIVNIIPGTIVLEIDQARRMIYAHVIDVTSERGVDKFYRQTGKVKRLLVRAFERENEWQPGQHGNNDDDADFGTETEAQR